MPASACFGTMARTASSPVVAISLESTLSPSARRTNRRVRFSGRGRLPVCVVNIRSVLRRITALSQSIDGGAPARRRLRHMMISLFEPTCLDVKLTLYVGVGVQVRSQIFGILQLGIEEYPLLAILRNQFGILHRGL